MKRLQILAIIFLWSVVLKVSDRDGPRSFALLRRLNRFGSEYNEIVRSIEKGDCERRLLSFIGRKGRGLRPWGKGK